MKEEKMPQNNELPVSPLRGLGRILVFDNYDSFTYNLVHLVEKITNKTSPILKGLPSTIEVGRYHSWIVNDQGFPAELEITARDDNGYIMALQHRTYDVQGVQFHPESVLTPDGETILVNWLIS